MSGFDRMVHRADQRAAARFRRTHDLVAGLAEVKRAAQTRMRAEGAPVEVARPADCRAEVRGEGDTVRVYESPRLEVTVSVQRDGTGILLDGWIAPPAVHDVVVMTLEGPVSLSSDVHGRFAVPGLPGGSVTVTVHMEPGPPVATPAFET